METNVNSRAKNSFKNMLISIISQIVTILLNFATRIVFVICFGEDFLGISGLFSNILTLLSLAELGVGGAMIYALYRPVAENDTAKITALMNYYRKLYWIIGCVVAGIGLVLIPFLGVLVNLENPIDNLVLYYVLFLSETVFSYFFVYKTSIINADQKMYLIQVVTALCYIIKFVLQVIVAFAIQNYIVYLVVHVVMTVLKNVALSLLAGRKYPFINNKKLVLEKSEKKEIWKNIKSILYYQVGGVLLNHTDSILISVMIGTVLVGHCSNYTLIITSIANFIALIFSSLQASIGNFVVKENTERQYKLFKALQMCTFWIYAFCSVCFLFLIQDFIMIVFGANYLLDDTVLLAMVINFYVFGILYPVYCFRSTAGLFKSTKYIMLITGLVNIGFSILLGYFFGIFGILIATPISRLLTNAWFEPFVLYRKFFNRSALKYALLQLIYTLLMLLIACAGYGVICLIELLQVGLVWRFVIKAVACLIIPNVIMFLLFFKSQEFKYVKDIMFKIVFKRTKRPVESIKQ